MRITFEKPTSIKKVLSFNQGVEPRWGKKGSTSRGTVWCTCGECVGYLLLLSECVVVGWFETKCSCGNHIDWSKVNSNI